MERADAAISVFEIEAKLAEIAYSTRTLAALPAEAEETMGELARLYDLAVVLQPEPYHSSYDNSIPQAVLFNSGGPVLMVPYIHKGALDARHVGIAEAGWPRARCVRCRFLTAAQAVTVIAINEVGTTTAKRSDQIVGHLAGAVRARIELLTAVGTTFTAPSCRSRPIRTSAC
jgi:hypothetical protein